MFWAHFEVMLMVFFIAFRHLRLGEVYYDHHFWGINSVLQLDERTFNEIIHKDKSIRF